MQVQLIYFTLTAPVKASVFKFWGLYDLKKNHKLDACGKQTVRTVYPLLGVIYKFFSVLTLQKSVACAACSPFGDTRFICIEKAKPNV